MSRRESTQHWLQRLGKVTHLCSSEMTHLRGNQESN